MLRPETILIIHILLNSWPTKRFSFKRRSAATDGFGSHLP